MNNLILSESKKYPSFSFQGFQHEYIIITSLNLGGAEKIVTDHLWSNSWNKYKIKYTLIVLYNKEKEHKVPNDVNIVRLNGKIENGFSLLSQISHENKTLVAHLINDKILEYLFSLNIKVNLVLHNDEQGWINKAETLKNQNISAIISICHHVENQIRKYTNKPIVTIRHQINYNNSIYNEEKKSYYRNLFKFNENDKVIGMVGRIAWQKNYSKAIEILYFLVQKDKNWKLIIVGGFEQSQQNEYFHLLRLINHYNLHKNVILTGFRNDIKDLINCFNIGLNTSHYEGLSIATQELLSNGLKIFCANICGQKEISDDKNRIIFYPPETSSLEISNIIENNTHNFDRISFSTKELENFSQRTWASHRIWNLLHHVGLKNENNNKFAFITSNLNIGGAQKSLVNLTLEFKKNNIYHPVIVTNQSNYFNFYKALVENEIEVFLAHESQDVFNITYSILNFLKNNHISKIFFWNVDSKIRLLLTKIGHGWLKTIDVSPGHYSFEEMTLDKNFMDGIYFNETEYHEKLSKIIFKYKPNKKDIPFYKIIKEKTSFISNGVSLLPQETTKKDYKIIETIKAHKIINKNTFNFIICGRISPSKHIDIIIQSFTEVIKTENANLFIVGSVEKEYFNYYNNIKKQIDESINDKIIFLGACDNAQNILPYFDCLIVLGTHQGCPNTILEAMASKIKIIANDSGGTKELINNKTGFLLKNTSIDEIKNTMILTIKHTHSKKIEEAYNLVKNEFSMTKMLSNYVNEINFFNHP